MCPAVACEMLMSRSPPVFSHSPPTGFLSEYTAFCLPADKFAAGRSCAVVRPSPPRSLSFPAPRPAAAAAPWPIRPCLVGRPDDPASPTRLKKRVVFADDRGMSLTHVRVMSEPSNVPPLWSFRFLAEVTRGVCAEPEAAGERWQLAFQQPASDYLDFRKKLEVSKVSLENVIVKEGEELAVGTVKVANVSFRKEVLVRASSDEWKSHEDAVCAHVPSAMGGAAGAYVLYDTFSFKVALPARASRLEFCVCFRCDEGEFWDNNGGGNYVLLKKAAPKAGSPTADDVPKSETEIGKMEPIKKCSDASRAKPDSWSEFASWTHLENSSPYW